MSEPTIESLVRGLTGRREAIRLLRYLGFIRAPRPNGLHEHLPAYVHAALSTSDSVLRACLVELRGALTSEVIHDVARQIRALDPITFYFILIVERGYARFAVACEGPDRGLRYVLLERGALRAGDIDVFAEMVPRTGEVASARAMRFGRALDRSRVTQRFFRDVVGVRELVSRAWTGVPRKSKQERDALALLLLSRLMFLYFLQRRGALGGDVEYLPHLLRQRAQSARGTFYATTLRTLFFGVLNRRPEKRSVLARSLGDLPYLNGGLFEEHRLELRHPKLDLSDDALARVFAGLLEKYRFTTFESVEARADGGDTLGIDPEMLGRIFQRLMPGEERDRTGTFYTPSSIVDRVVSDALVEHLSFRCALPACDVAGLISGKAVDVAAASVLTRELSSLRVLDPACGSGAFLMGALVRVAQLHEVLGTDVVEARRDIVARTLHGVDLLEDAALICSLRLWLSLIPQHQAAVMSPLPNLDRRIRQGDALIDPLDLRGASAAGSLDVPWSPELRSTLASLEPLAARYVRAEPEEKRVLRRRLTVLERRLARIWTSTLAMRLERLEKELRARAADKDLFGDASAHAVVAQRRLGGVTEARVELRAFADEMAHTRTLPFFSFRVHFAEAAGGFDMVLSNPPWVRAHRWPPAVRRLLRERYRVCRDAGWPEAARLSRLPAGAGAQVDLSLLFLERCIDLLAVHGTLGMLLPAKLFRSLYAGGARRLVREKLVPIAIEDHSLDHRAIFDADAFTAVLVARRSADDLPTAAPHEVRVTLARAGAPPLRFNLPCDDLPLVTNDDHAPWLLAPPACKAAFRQMQRSPVLGQDARVCIRRGVMTGCNDVLVLRHVEPKLGDLALIRAEGHGRDCGVESGRGLGGYIEASSIRPALRGTDVGAWCFDVQRHLIWVPANHDPAMPPPPRTRRYLLRHQTRLSAEHPVAMRDWARCTG